MKTLRIISLSAVAFLVPGFSLWSQENSLGKPVAVVTLTKTQAISAGEFKRAIDLFEKHRGAPLTDADKKQLLGSMIDKILIFQKAEEEGLTVSEKEVTEIQKRLLSQQSGHLVSLEELKKVAEEQTGLPFKEYLREAVYQATIQKYIAETKKKEIEGIPDPTKQEVQDFYERQSTKFVNPALIRFSHIFFDTKDKSAKEKAAIKMKAEALLKKIRNGAISFEEAIRTESEDPSSKARNGDMGFLAKGNPATDQLLGKAFVNRLFDTDINEILLLESLSGYHIIKKTAHIQKRFLGIDDPLSPTDSVTVREGIVRTINLERQQAAFIRISQELAETLRKQASLRITEKNFP